jgi:hypothetical protein
MRVPQYFWLLIALLAGSCGGGAPALIQVSPGYGASGGKSGPIIEAQAVLGSTTPEVFLENLDCREPRTVESCSVSLCVRAEPPDGLLASVGSLSVKAGQLPETALVPSFHGVYSFPDLLFGEVAVGDTVIATAKSTGGDILFSAASPYPPPLGGGQTTVGADTFDRQQGITVRWAVAPGYEVEARLTGTSAAAGSDTVRVFCRFGRDEASGMIPSDALTDFLPSGNNVVWPSLTLTSVSSAKTSDAGYDVTLVVEGDWLTQLMAWK